VARTDDLALVDAAGLIFLRATVIAPRLVMSTDGEHCVHAFETQLKDAPNLVMPTQLSAEIYWH
jgi:hypothetical protein